ncbi:MAG: hypothetical protein D6675_12390 [Gemmatimonadetes bacterium]|nr:MAG: hypothetical protein D6675_12390 [Gemmatimonadota bacterium]
MKLFDQINVLTAVAALVFFLLFGDAGNARLYVYGAFFGAILLQYLASQHLKEKHLIDSLTNIILTTTLVYTTGAYESAFFPLYTIPIIIIAAEQHLKGVILVCTLASIGFGSTLIFSPQAHELTVFDHEIFETVSKIILFFVIGLVVYFMGREYRREKIQTAKMIASLEAQNTELQRARTEISRQEKMAAIGRLSAGIAHEIRNPLSIIKSSTDLIQSMELENLRCRVLTAAIQEEASRLNEFINDFLRYSRPVKLQLEQRDINEILHQVVNLAQETLPPHVNVIETYDPHLPLTAVDRNALHQVFLNLFLNAIQAMPHGGQLTLKTRHITHRIEIAFIDTGLGIPRKNLSMLFEPFFTTKDEGTGLGLAIAANIISEHGGRILVDSELGNGTVFTIVLPIRDITEDGNIEDSPVSDTVSTHSD